MPHDSHKTYQTDNSNNIESESYPRYVICDWSGKPLKEKDMCDSRKTINPFQFSK